MRSGSGLPQSPRARVWVQDDPEVQGRPPRAWPFVPFSGGSGVCPGRNVVLLLTSGMLAALIGDRTVRLKDAHRLPPGQLPGTLDNYTLRFEIDAATHPAATPPQYAPAKR